MPRITSTGQRICSQTGQSIDVLDRPGASSAGEALVVVEAEAAVLAARRAVLGEVAPLGVGQRAEAGMDLAQMRLERVAGWQNAGRGRGSC